MYQHVKLLLVVVSKVVERLVVTRYD